VQKKFDNNEILLLAQSTVDGEDGKDYRERAKELWDCKDRESKCINA
jgi:hypothetical protein